MKGISINLLPTESTEVQKKIVRTRKVKLMSISFLLIMFFLASLLITFRVLQSRSITKLEAEAQAAEVEISDLRDKESTFVLLKDRLDRINTIKSLPSKQKEIYDLVIRVLPSAANVSSITLDQSGNLTMSASAPDSVALASLIQAITDEESFNKLASVSVDSLSRGQDGTYRMNLKLTAK